MNQSKLSDDDYVALIRQRDHSVRRLQWVAPALGLVMFCMLMFGVSQVPRYLLSSPTETSIRAAGVFGGVLLGMCLAMLAMLGGIMLKKWFDGRTGFRTERLLIKFYDQLKAKEASNHAVERTAR